MSSCWSIIRPCMGSASSRFRLSCRGLRRRRSCPTQASTTYCRLLLARDHLAEQLELLAVEALELHRLDRREVAGARVDGDARQQGLDAEALEARGLLH